MKQCEICNIIFTNPKVYSNHVRWKHTNIEYKRQKCNVCKKQIRFENFLKHTSVCIIKNCKHCNAVISGYRKKFCNSTCSASYNNRIRKNNYSYITPEWREKQRQHNLRNWNNGVHDTTRREIYTSKTERLIVNYIKEKYPTDFWKSGGRLKLQENVYISRDLWSDKLCVCFEYDGVWHFKNIKGQLKKKQIKDRLLEEWCLLNNYRLIRIDEEHYVNPQQIENLIYKNTKQIIKVGERY